MVCCCIKSPRFWKTYVRPDLADQVSPATVAAIGAMTNAVTTRQVQKAGRILSARRHKYPHHWIRARDPAMR